MSDSMDPQPWVSRKWPEMRGECPDAFPESILTHGVDYAPRSMREQRQAKAEQIARVHLDAVLGNAPSERMDALDHEDYAQFLDAFTRAALAGMEAAR